MNRDGDAGAATIEGRAASARARPGRREAHQPGDEAAAMMDDQWIPLRLLGIDHRRPTSRHDGIGRRPTDVHGGVIAEILA